VEAEGAGIVDYFFLSVAAVCATAIVCFRMHLAAVKPAVTRKEYEALLAEVAKVTDRVNKINFNAMGRGK